MLKPDLDAAKANPRAISGRIASKGRVDTNGQRRHDLREDPVPQYVDQSRSHLNRILMEPRMGGEMRKICDQRRTESGRERKRRPSDKAAVSVSGIITFGTEAQKWVEALSIEQQDALFREVAEAIAEHLQTSLHGLVIHLDETAIHAHFQLSAVASNGYPVSQLASRAVLEDIQTLIAMVAQQYEPRIERGHSKRARVEAGAQPHEVIHRSVRQLHEDLPLEIAEREGELEALRLQQEPLLREIGRQRERAVKARAKADRLGEKEDRAAQAIKTAGVYEERAKKAEEKLAALEARIAELEADLARRQAVHAQEAATLDSRIEETRGLLADQEETKRLGEDILAQIDEELEERQAESDRLSASIAQRRAEETKLDALLGSKQPLAAKSFAQVSKAWDLARAGDFETPVTLEDLVAEGRSQKEAARLHDQMRRDLAPRPVMKGWRLWWEAASEEGSRLLGWRGRVSPQLDEVFYELRDLCRKVRREREERREHVAALKAEAEESRAKLQKELESTRAQAAADLETVRTQAVEEVRREAEEGLQQERRLFMRALEAEVATRRAELQAELETLRREAADTLAEGRRKALENIQGEGAAARKALQMELQVEKTKAAEVLGAAQAELDRRRAAEAEFLSAFQSGEVARVGVDEKSGRLTFWRSDALPEERKQALRTAWGQVGPELRSMLQNLSERRRELEAREAPLKSRERASALEEARLDRRREWRVRLVLGVRRRRTEIQTREISCAEKEANLESKEAALLHQEKRMRRELETAQAALDQRREAEARFMTAFQSGEVARVGVNDKGRLTFWFAQSLPEDQKTPLRAAWGQVSPEFQTLLQAVGEERRKALEQGRVTGTEEIKAAVAAGVEALHRGEIVDVKREDETWSLRYHPGLQEERRGLLARILEPVLKIVAPILRRIVDFLKGQDLQVKAYAEAVRRPRIDWSSGPSM